MPYYPGWRATVDGEQLPIVHVDLALMGVVVPAGDREIQLSFRSDSFKIGVVITLAGLVVCALLVAASARARRAALPATG
ncbi:MAG: YfhO family protein [Bryobacteraceae bacterium]